MRSMKNYGEIHVGSNNLVSNVLLQLLSFKSQNCEVYFSNTFELKTRFSTNPVFVIIYFHILCSNTDMPKKPITWMTIRVTKSTLW